MMSPGPNDFVIQRLKQLRKEEDREVRPRSKGYLGPFGGDTSYALLGAIAVGCTLLLVLIEYLPW